MLIFKLTSHVGLSIMVLKYSNPIILSSKKINLNRSFSNVSLNENEVGRPPSAQRFNF